MKFLLVLCTIAVCALAIPSDNEETKKKYKEYLKICIEDSGTTDEVAQKLRNGDFSTRDEPAQCFIDCFFRKVGFMNEDGEVQTDAIIQKMKERHTLKTEGTFEELIGKCAQEKGEGKCETAFKVYECYRGSIEYKTEKPAEKTD